jgi:hypothetical protein
VIAVASPFSEGARRDVEPLLTDSSTREDVVDVVRACFVPLEKERLLGLLAVSSVEPVVVEA